MKILKDESGQAMILTLLCMTCLLGFVGFAVDVGVLLNAKRQMQTAADSAAVAAASELNYGTGNMTAAAHAAAAQNGVTVGVNGGAVTINPPPLSGAYAGQIGYVEAIVSQNQPTFFMKMFNFASMKVSARAVAMLGPGNNCVYTLGAAGTDILLNGSVDLTTTNCSIVDDSTSSNALLVNGSGTLSAQAIGVVGKDVINGPVIVNPTPVTGIVAEPDPLAYLSPPANPGSCTSQTFNTTSGTLNPGCYSSILLNGGGTLTLNPGVYYMTGSLTVNGTGTLKGTGITIYMASSGSSFTDSGNTTLNLTAPTSGDYNGILFYQNSSDTSALTINGSSNSSLQGILYAPTANLTLNGSGSTKVYTAIVTKSLTFNGNGTLQNYAMVNGESPLTAARLVE